MQNTNHFLPILSSLNLLILLALTIFIYLKNRAGSDGYRSIMYRIVDKWVQFIKHPLSLLYKGYFPLFNYDDEPSVSMGIVSQLPSSHLPYTECQPSSKTGSCPTVKFNAGYSSCFFVWLLLTCIPLSWYWFTQWTLYHYCFLLVFCRCSPFQTPSFTGFCSRTLSSLRCLPSATRQSSGLCCFLCCQWCLCYYWAFDILQQFLRVISCPCLQDGVNHP